MANCGGKQSIWVTKGREEIIAERYKKIQDIVKRNSDVPFKYAIEVVAGVKIGTWYNYISHGKQRGRISKFTVEKLSEFSGIPVEVFTGEYDFTEDYINKFSDKVKERLREDKKDTNKCTFQNTDINTDVYSKLKLLSQVVDKINNTQDLNKVSNILKKLMKKVELRRDTLAIDEEINKESYVK